MSGDGAEGEKCSIGYSPQAGEEQAMDTQTDPQPNTYILLIISSYFSYSFLRLYLTQFQGH
jgi:hypothetical protein